MQTNVNTILECVYVCVRVSIQKYAYTWACVRVYIAYIAAPDLVNVHIRLGTISCCEHMLEFGEQNVTCRVVCVCARSLACLNMLQRCVLRARLWRLRKIMEKFALTGFSPFCAALQ